MLIAPTHYMVVGNNLFIMKMKFIIPTYHTVIIDNRCLILLKRFNCIILYNNLQNSHIQFKIVGSYLNLL